MAASRLRMRPGEEGPAASDGMVLAAGKVERPVPLLPGAARGAAEGRLDHGALGLRCNRGAKENERPAPFLPGPRPAPLPTCHHILGIASGGAAPLAAGKPSQLSPFGLPR